MGFNISKFSAFVKNLGTFTAGMNNNNVIDTKEEVSAWQTGCNEIRAKAQNELGVSNPIESEAMQDVEGLMKQEFYGLLGAEFKEKADEIAAENGKAVFDADFDIAGEMVSYFESTGEIDSEKLDEYMQKVHEALPILETDAELEAQITALTSADRIEQNIKDYAALLETFNDETGEDDELAPPYEMDAELEQQKTQYETSGPNGDISDPLREKVQTHFNEAKERLTREFREKYGSQP